MTGAADSVVDRLVAVMHVEGLLVGEDRASIALRLVAHQVEAADVGVLLEWARGMGGLEFPERWVSTRLKTLRGEALATLVDEAEAALSARVARLAAASAALAEAGGMPSHANAGPPPSGPCRHGVLASVRCDECAAADRESLALAYAGPAFEPRSVRDRKFAARVSRPVSLEVLRRAPLTDEQVREALGVRR